MRVLDKCNGATVTGLDGARRAAPEVSLATLNRIEGELGVRLDDDVLAVIAIGDCAPAAAALDAASSGVPQMEALLAAARTATRQWLGVAVPREWNLDADRLSHPSQLPAVLADARDAGLEPIVATIPEECWTALRG